MSDGTALESVVVRAPWLAVWRSRSDDRTAVRCSGTMCTVSSAAVRPTLLSWVTGCAHRVELDLSELDLIDGRGLTLLIELQRRCEESGGSLAVARASPCVVRVMQVCGLAGPLGLGGLHAA